LGGKVMCETATSVSLFEGSASKLYAAEVTNHFGSPLKDVEVAFVLEGEGSLAGDAPVRTVEGRTDAMGDALISFNRLAGSAGRLAASLRVQCPVEAAHIRLRLVALRPTPTQM
jgi:hypothetical protein